MKQNVVTLVPNAGRGVKQAMATEPEDEGRIWLEGPAKLDPEKRIDAIRWAFVYSTPLDKLRDHLPDEILRTDYSDIDDEEEGNEEDDTLDDLSTTDDEAETITPIELVDRFYTYWRYARKGPAKKKSGRVRFQVSKTKTDLVNLAYACHVLTTLGVKMTDK